MQIQEYEDGVYFNLPEADYHRIPALSASGVKNLLISPVDFWARSWMNPRNNDGEDDVTDSDAKIIGSAYHKRVLEGRDLFYQHYAPVFENDAEASPSKVDELRLILKNHRLPTGGSKDELIARISSKLPGIRLAAVERAEYYAKHDGKIFLTQDLIESIEISAAMIEKNPVLSRCFQGGFPEVTVLWTVEHKVMHPNGAWTIYKVRFKSRFDYLKAKAIIDLKTFENRAMKSVDKSIYGEIAKYKYHIQAVLYMRAIEAAKKLAHWHGCTIEQRKAIEATKEHEFFFVFQQKGIAPFARGFKFPRTTMWSVGGVMIDGAIGIYIDNLERFGAEQWIDTAEIETLEDEGFPVWATSDL